MEQTTKERECSIAMEPVWSLPVSGTQGKPLRGGAPRARAIKALSMDGRYWSGPAAREGGNLDVKKELPDREKTIAARVRQCAIGRELRRIYDEVVQEPVPDDFLELLKK